MYFDSHSHYQSHPSHVLADKSVYSILYNKSPSYSHFKIFGCYVLLLPSVKANSSFLLELEGAYLLVIFMEQKDINCFILVPFIFFSRDVIIHEHIFSFKTIDSPAPLSSSPIVLPKHISNFNPKQFPNNNSSNLPQIPPSLPILPFQDYIHFVPLRKSTRQHKSPNYLQ